MKFLIIALIWLAVAGFYMLIFIASGYTWGTKPAGDLMLIAVLIGLVCTIYYHMWG